MDDFAENAEMLRGLSEYSVDVFHSFLLYAVFEFDLISTTREFLVCKAIFIEKVKNEKKVCVDPHDQIMAQAVPPTSPTMTMTTIIIMFLALPLPQGDKASLSLSFIYT